MHPAYCPLTTLPAPMRGSPQTENLKTDLNSALEHTFENSFELFLTKIIIVAKAAGDFKWNLQFLCYVLSEGTRYV